MSERVAGYRVCGERTAAVLETIEYLIDRDGWPPTVREIQRAAGMSSTSQVHYYLERLEELGYIKRMPGGARAIKVLEGRRG